MDILASPWAPEKRQEMAKKADFLGLIHDLALASATFRDVAVVSVVALLLFSFLSLLSA